MSKPVHKRSFSLAVNANDIVPDLIFMVRSLATNDTFSNKFQNHHALFNWYTRFLQPVISSRNINSSQRISTSEFKREFYDQSIPIKIHIPCPSLVVKINFCHLVTEHFKFQVGMGMGDNFI